MTDGGRASLLAIRFQSGDLKRKQRKPEFSNALSPAQGTKRQDNRADSAANCQDESAKQGKTHAISTCKQNESAQRNCSRNKQSQAPSAQKNAKDEQSALLLPTKTLRSNKNWEKRENSRFCFVLVSLADRMKVDMQQSESHHLSAKLVETARLPARPNQRFSLCMLVTLVDIHCVEIATAAEI